MSVPTLTLDSQHPGLMAVTVGGPTGSHTCRMTREEARDFGIAVLAMSEQGFMRGSEREHVTGGAAWDRSVGVSSADTGHHDARGRFIADEDDASVQHEHPYADELHLGGG